MTMAKVLNFPQKQNSENKNKEISNTLNSPFSKNSKNKNKNKNKSILHSKKINEAQIIHLEEYKQKNKDRRTIERTQISGLVGAFIVVPERGLLPVDLENISEEGLAFNMNQLEGQFKEGEQVEMRFYLHRKQYFQFSLKISHGINLDAQGLTRQGASFLNNSFNEEAIRHFVRFIQSVHWSKDNGDLLTSSLVY